MNSEKTDELEKRYTNLFTHKGESRNCAYPLPHNDSEVYKHLFIVEEKVGLSRGEEMMF